MQLSANFESLQVFFQPFELNENGVICDSRHLPLPANDITFVHHHNCCELGITFKGNGLFTINSKIYSVSVGDIVFIPQGIKHYSKSLDPENKARCRFIYFDAEKLLKSVGITDETRISKLLEKLNITSPVLTDKDKSGRYEALKRFADEMFKENCNLELCSVYFLEYLIKSDISKTADESHRYDKEMENVLRYMTLHFSEEITTDQLARLCYLSKSQLNRRFQSAYGISPIAWLNRFRLYSARELLQNTDFSIPLICEKTGFKNTSDLYRHFKAKFGLSPNQYRQQT